MANQWARISRRNKERMRLVAQESFVELSASIIVKSPVDTGLFRNNWFAGLNKPNTTTTTRVAKKRFGERGGARFNELLQLSTKMDFGDSLFLTNSLPYARRLEYGHSKKMAPSGMVRISVAQWPVIVKKVARNIP